MKKVVYGHRGAPAEQPENTLEGFACALEAGADALETDVHLTSDGVVVIAHDDTGERCCREPARVDETPLAALRLWDAGATHATHRGARGEYRVPTLAEALDAFPEAFFNIDVKPRDAGAAAAVVRVVKAHGAEARVRLTSFFSSNVRAVRALGYTNTGLGLSEVVLLAALPRAVLERLAPRGNAAQIPTHQGPLRLDGAAFIAKCHAVGVRVDYWTIDDPVEAARLFALGADGVVTNDPRAIVPVARAYRGRK